LTLALPAYAYRIRELEVKVFNMYMKYQTSRRMKNLGKRRFKQTYY